MLISSSSDSKASLASDDSASTHSARSPPTSMPMLSGPKRAAPPRKRSAKSPSPSAAVALQADSTTVDEKGSSDEAAQHTPVEGERTTFTEGTTPPDETVSPPLHDETKLEETVTVTSVDTSALDNSEVKETEEVIDNDNVVSTAPDDAAQEGPVPEEHDEDEDEDSRRKRIAERIAKAGGFNPFGGGARRPPPRRQSSTASSTLPTSPRPDDVEPQLSVPEDEESPEAHVDEPSAQASNSADIDTAPGAGQEHNDLSGKHEEEEHSNEQRVGEEHQDGKY